MLMIPCKRRNYDSIEEDETRFMALIIRNYYTNLLRENNELLFILVTIS